MSSTKKPAIGIDLGTTFTCLGIWRNGTAEIIANNLGSRLTPSCVSFSQSEIYIGNAAITQRTKNPKNTVYDVKRLIGRRFEDREVKEDLKRWPFQVVDVGGKPRIQVEFKKETKTFAPEEISAMILRQMKEVADKYLLCDVKDAVITVPAYFNNAQRQATIDAGKIAGLNVLRIINEPTAAALAYAFKNPPVKKKNVLIYDLGGGTFDVSVVSMEKGPKIQVLSTTGDTHLGGGDFDALIVKYVAARFKRKKNKYVFQNARAHGKINQAAEEAKKVLSFETNTNVYIDALIDGIDLNTSLSREKFEDLCKDLFQSTLPHVRTALDDAKLTKDDVDEVVLVGGSTRIPKVKELLREFFPGKSLNESINPDEAVAFGAAVQAAILTGHAGIEFKDVVPSDVTPMSLGIRTLFGDGIMSIIIPKLTRIPCIKSEYYHTLADNQTAIEIKVYEGEMVIATENNFLDEFLLTGIPPAPAGEGTAKVTFNLNANGVLKVTAVEMKTGKAMSIIINMKETCKSDEELTRAIADAKI